MYVNLLLFVSSSAITHRGESEKLPYFSITCHICRPFPSWHCSSSFALCAFLVEGISLTFFVNVDFRIHFETDDQGFSILAGK